MATGLRRSKRLLQSLCFAPDAFFCSMYICYLDESGTIEPSSNSSHFVLIGFAIPASTWKGKDTDILTIKQKYNLGRAEIHSGWMLRAYPEQFRISDFDKFDYDARRRAVLAERMLNLARPRINTQQKAILKNYKKTEPYIHLTLNERLDFIEALCNLIDGWRDCRLFGEAHDKRCSFGDRAYENAFEQIVTRFNTYLTITKIPMGIIVQDNNETVSRKLTIKMREFHTVGTLWSNIDKIVETPLFVDSQLTSMVQIADLCAYATRRFFEKGETNLFDRIYKRFDRHKNKLVGLRHYTGMQNCLCRVCEDHKGH